MAHVRSSMLAVIVIATATALAGCKIGIAVFDGGNVVSDSGSRDCFEGSTCTIEVKDTTFRERFTAVPRAGYMFKQWSEQSHMCKGSTNPVCSVSTQGLSGNDLAENIIASETVYYLIPEFAAGPPNITKPPSGL